MRLRAIRFALNPGPEFFFWIDTLEALGARLAALSRWSVILEAALLAGGGGQRSVATMLTQNQCAAMILRQLM